MMVHLLFLFVDITELYVGESHFSFNRCIIE